MPVYIIPTYRDLFSDDVPDPEELLRDIPSNIVLYVLAFINAQVMLGPDSLANHKHIFKQLARSFPNIAYTLQEKLKLFETVHRGNIRIFGTPYLLDFMQHELQFFRKIPDFIDTNQEQSLRILQAYFVFVEMAQEKIHKKTEAIQYDRNDKYWFQKRTWPMIIEQYEINHLPNPGIFAVKAFVFLQYFNEHSKYQKFAQMFLSSSKQETIWHYILDLLQIVGLSLQGPNANEIHLFRLDAPPVEFLPLFKQISTTSTIFKSVPNSSKNYTGIRSGPLFNFNEDYVVLNWHFLYQKFYKGLVFDFYSRSGISDVFRSLPDYLSVIGNNITERHFFQPIMKHLLSKKYTVLEFDTEGQKHDAKPDLYYRDGNDILLIELKDLMLPAEIISDYSFEGFSKQLEKKFIKNEDGNNKGILQILNHIKQINESILSYDHFTQKGVKKRNLKIYPVIVYTNFEYSLPGVEDYLRKRFEEELTLYKSQVATWEIGKIHELVMINLDFFLRATAEGEAIDLFTLIHDYNKSLDRRLKKLQIKPDAESALKLFSGFEWIHGNTLKKKKSDIAKLFQVLGIRINIPPNL